MTGEYRPTGRRGFLRLSAAGVAVLSATTMLAACGSSSDSSAGGATGVKSAANPFGVAKNSSVDAVVFDGGFGTGYVSDAGKLVKSNQGVTVKVTPATDIATVLQPRLLGGNAPDLFDDSGAKQIPLATILDSTADLSDVVNSNNLEGQKIADTLYPNVLTPTTFNGKVEAIDYAMSVYGMWYSKTLFQKYGWTPPKTWAEALALGAKAKAQGKYLFTWGKEAASYYLNMVIDSAIKEGGDKTRLALENLEPNSWSDPAVVGAFEGLKKIVDAGYVKPGGAGTNFTAAQAGWSLKEDTLLYPSGSWIESEMKDQTAPNFQMVAAPSPAVSDHPALGFDAVRASSSEPFVVPASAKNAAGGKELLRTMLSKQAATNFAKTTHSLPVVKGVVPADGFGDSALKSQSSLLANAGSNVFNYSFLANYGFGDTTTTVFNQFLAGKMSVKDAIDTMQKYADQVRNDPSIKKVEVK